MFIHHVNYALVGEVDWVNVAIQAVVPIYVCAGESVISYHKISSDGVLGYRLWLTLELKQSAPRTCQPTYIAIRPCAGK